MAIGPVAPVALVALVVLVAQGARAEAEGLAAVAAQHAARTIARGRGGCVASLVRRSPVPSALTALASCAL